MSGLTDSDIVNEIHIIIFIYSKENVRDSVKYFLLKFDHSCKYFHLCAIQFLFRNFIVISWYPQMLCPMELYKRPCDDSNPFSGILRRNKIHPCTLNTFLTQPAWRTYELLTLGTVDDKRLILICPQKHSPWPVSIQITYFEIGAYHSIRSILRAPFTSFFHISLHLK